MFQKRHNFMLMAALGALSAGAAAVADAFPAEGITLRNRVTEQECTFHTAEAVHTFGANIENRDDWAPVEPAAASTEDVHTLTDVVQSANAQADAIAGTDAATLTPAPAPAPAASPVANDTAAPGPATGETAPAGE